MPTTTVKTIGTGGDYSTIQAWEDACPSNLITNDEIWQGQLKNQTFSGAPVVSFGGITTDSTRYIELRCEAGASFSDNANAQTNALRYNTSNGAALTGNGNYGSTPTIYKTDATHVKLFGLQVECTGNGACVNFTGANAVIERCIFEAFSTGFVAGVSGARLQNSLFVQRRASSPGSMLSVTFACDVYGCTFVAAAGTPAVALVGNYGTPTFTNCAFFGATAIKSGGNTPTYTTCVTDIASPPSGFTGSVAYSTSSGALFQNITDSTRDFRIKSGSSLIDVGTTSSTYGTPDIVGTARPSGSSYDVGAWEYVAAAAALAAPALRAFPRQILNF